MPHYNGKFNNAIFGHHTTAIEGIEPLILALSKMPYKTRIKLGVISSVKPKAPFINCTVTTTSLIFKVGMTSVQTITVTVKQVTPQVFINEFVKRFDQVVRVRG